MGYIHKIIDYFFHHTVSETTARQVYRRMVVPEKDEERDEALRSIWDSLETEELSETDIESGFERLKRATGLAVRPMRKKRVVHYNWMKMAATWVLPFMMLCSSGYLYYLSLQKQKTDTGDAIAYTQHYVPLGTREQVTLPDGSEVWLNAGSLLVYPSAFSSSERNVYLVGEGFFTIKKDRGAPFVVSTNHLHLEVLGTTFNISAYPEDRQVKATLETGKVKINVPNDSIDYILNPNKQLIYTPSTGEVEQFDVCAADYSVWRLGGLYFNDTPFSNVLQTLERTYGVKIHLRTSVYKNQRLRVHFNKDESLENVLQIIGLIIPNMEYKIVGNDVYIG